jgi:hypothetical protein
MRLIAINSTISSTLNFIHPPTVNTFIEGLNGTKDQVPLACKVAISNFMVVCHQIKRSASLKFRGSRVREDVTRGAKDCDEEVETEVVLTVLFFLGRSTI